MAVNKNVVLVIAFIGSFLAPFMISAVNIAVPSIEKEFPVDAVKVSWISTAYLLAATMLLLPVGRVADIYGRKKIFMLGITIYTLSAFLLSTANSADIFILYRFIEGLGAAMIFSTATAIVTEVFPPGERGRALGITVSAAYLGLSLGPFIGGYLTQEYGWRSVFYINIPIGLLAVALILWKLKDEWAEAKGEKFDYLGSALYMATLAAIIYALATPNAEGIASLILGIILLIAFITYEEKTKSPILNVPLLRHNRRFLFSNLAALINYSATYTVALLLSLYLQHVRGFDPETAGIILITQPVLQAIFSPLAGKLSDKIDAGTVASVGMALTVISLIMLSQVNTNTDINYITAALIIIGLGFALFSSPNTNAIMSSVQPKQYGIASATLATMRLTGQMLSAGITTTLFILYLGTAEIIPTQYPLFLKTLETAFTISATLCLIGVFASLARGKQQTTQAT